MSTTLADQLTQAFPDVNWEAEKVLAPLTYFKIGGPAEVFALIKEPEVLAKVSAWCADHQVPLKMLGGASNVIVADEGVRGVVVRLANETVEKLDQVIDDRQLIRAGAAMKMALLVRKTLDWQLTGLEYFLGVPGTLGGAVVNNAHYMSDLIGQHITRVQVVNKAHQLVWLDQSECDFGYDHSRFQTSGEVVIAVELALSPGTSEHSQKLVKQATEYRATTQPLGMPSSGCIFQNTPNSATLRKLFPQFEERQHLPAGFLIDQAGLKGTTIGPIEVSQVHAAFMVNHGGGTAAEVKELIALVKSRVKAKFGVDLVEEVFYLG